MVGSVGVKPGADMKNPDSPEVLSRVHEGLAIVEYVARRFARELGGTLELDELLGYGRIALLDAARIYNPSRGIPFDAYAAWRIRCALIDVARSSRMALPRRAYQRLRAIEAATLTDEGRAEETFSAQPEPSAPSAARRFAESVAATASAMALAIMPEMAIQGDGERVGIEQSDPEQKLSTAQLNALVLRLIDDLPHDEAQLVRRHYFDDEPFAVVAKDLKISRFWASRLHGRAIVRLNQEIERAG
jgi:RNA polymerase sigma factor for flagellar operon FliA